MHRGYVKLWRKVGDDESGMMSDARLFLVWMKCLITAAHKTRTIRFLGQDVELQPGEFIFGRGIWSRQLGLTEKVVRNLIGTLQKRANIRANKRANTYTIFSIVNWDIYQGEDDKEGQQMGQPMGQLEGQQRANKGPTIKNDKNEKNKKRTLPIPDESGLSESYLTAKKRKLSGQRLELFKRFWSAWGDKNGKAEAADSWLDIPGFTPALAETIITAAAKEAVRRETIKANGGRYKWAQGWLTAKRWESYEAEARPGATEPTTPERLATMRGEWEAVVRMGSDRPEVVKHYWPVLTEQERAQYGGRVTA